MRVIGFLCGMVVVLLCACGQKGALYLPEAPTAAVDVSAEIDSDANLPNQAQNY